jgi:hypothetical protein
VADIFDSYELAAAWDEMFERPGAARGPYQGLGALQPFAAAGPVLARQAGPGGEQQ